MATNYLLADKTAENSHVGKSPYNALQPQKPKQQIYKFFSKKTAGLAWIHQLLLNLFDNTVFFLSHDLITSLNALFQNFDWSIG